MTDINWALINKLATKPHKHLNIPDVANILGREARLPGGRTGDRAGRRSAALR
jgi:hypothetical protein